jgi:signal transduction histidine kinase
MRDTFSKYVFRKRRRSFLYYAGIFVIAFSGIAFSTFLKPLLSGEAGWGSVLFQLPISILGALMGVLLIISARQETRAIDLFDWLQDLNSLLARLSAPINIGNVYPVCEKLVSAFAENTGWIMLIRAPGLLIRGEVKRRKYLPIVSSFLDGEWNINIVENHLKDLIENDVPENNITAKTTAISRKSESTWTADLADSVLMDQIRADGVSAGLRKKRFGLRRNKEDDYPMLIWTSRLKSGDISTGLAIALGNRKSKPDTMTIQALTTGLDLFVQRIGSILTEVIQRREGLGIENLGLIMRVLAHEINNDLQGALNTTDKLFAIFPNITMEQLVKLRATQTRAGHWSHLMREAPFLVDDVLSVERNIVSLPKVLSESIDESRQAWPDISFVLELPKGRDTLDVVGDQHLHSIIRNLLHNAASFSPEDGIVRITVAEDGENARVYVHDEGPGVDPADTDKIFSPLSSYKEGRRVGVRADYGMGVGLTISRAISRAYGGGLICHSNLEKEGGCFEVFIPLAYDD